MAVIEVKGYIHEVGAVEFVGVNNTRKQSIVIKKPAYIDEFGEVKGEDEYWKAEMLGQRIDALNLQKHQEGQKVRAELFVNSKMLTSRQTGQPVYWVNVGIKAIEFIGAGNGRMASAMNNLQNGTPTAQVISSQIHRPAPAGNDDMPF